MSYLTQAQLETRFGAGDLKAWTDDDASGAIDATIVAGAIADAEAQIDQAACQHYTTPLTLTSSVTASVVRVHAGSIAGYLLASRRPQNLPENVRRQYEDALAWLKRLEAGQVHLPGESAVAATKPTGGIVVTGGTPLVDRDTMDGL